jgi:spore germination cell wall hydrolase CwlJ-like protein
MLTLLTGCSTVSSVNISKTLDEVIEAKQTVEDIQQIDNLGHLIQFVDNVEKIQSNKISWQPKLESDYSLNTNYSLTSSANERMKEKLAKVIWCEDRSSEKGMEAVLSVVYNRSQEKTIEGLHGEIAKKGQFGCYNLNKKIPSKGKDRQMYEYAKGLVELIVLGEFKPITIAMYFYNTREKTPKWAYKKRYVASIGAHRFYV